ncbi:MAG TPA: SAF domain-containing protein [Ilumatobacteraceae bacterium]|nr:SAF domain-containing protein [Ilumatobacteraceae bacterium]
MAASSRSGFRPSSRSRVRITVGTLLSIVAVGVVLLVFSTADRRVGVLQVVRDLPAGARLGAADVRSIELSTDPSLAVVKSADIATVVGQYTKVRIVTGGLLATGLLQSGALVAPGSAVVAVTIPSGELPAGLRERSQVQIVIPVTGDDVALLPVVGRVVGLPDAPDSVTGQLSVSFEVAAADAVAVASATRVRIVLLDPGVDLSGTTP